MYIFPSYIFTTYWPSLRSVLVKYRTDVSQVGTEPAMSMISLLYGFTFIRSRASLSKSSPLQTIREISDRLWTNQITSFPYSNRSLPHPYTVHVINVYIPVFSVQHRAINRVRHRQSLMLRSFLIMVLFWTETSGKHVLFLILIRVAI